jgi:hypothetical protein
MLKALANISPSQLLDRRLFVFGSLSELKKANLEDELDNAISSHSDLTLSTLAPVTLTSAF